MPKRREVESWLANTDHPQLPAIRALRKAILAADPRMDECIKWKSPTFTYEGNFASINPRAKAHVSLMLHQGAALPGEHPRLEGGGDTVRYARFEDVADVKAAAADIRALVAAWCAWKDGDAKPGRRKPDRQKPDRQKSARSRR